MVDINVGRLARWLRAMGYDALLFTAKDDNDMVRAALAEGRIILTKDGEITRRRLATSGRLRVLHIESQQVWEQLRQVAAAFHLDSQRRPFTMCLECNQPLEWRDKEAVRDRVPPYVFRTQQEFSECPRCHRIYWQGSHWRAMSRELNRLVEAAG